MGRIVPTVTQSAKAKSELVRRKAKSPSLSLRPSLSHTHTRTQNLSSSVSLSCRDGEEAAQQRPDVHNEDRVGHRMGRRQIQRDPYPLQTPPLLLLRVRTHSISLSLSLIRPLPGNSFFVQSLIVQAYIHALRGRGVHRRWQRLRCSVRISIGVCFEI